MHQALSLYEEQFKAFPEVEIAWKKAISPGSSNDRLGFSEYEYAVADVVQSFFCDSREMLSEMDCECSEESVRRCLIERKAVAEFAPKPARMVEEMLDLTFARLQRLTRSLIGMENRSLDEEVLIFEDPVLLESLIFCYLRTVEGYLKRSRLMVILPEGRIDLDGLFQRISKITQTSSLMNAGTQPGQQGSFYEKKVQRLIDEYFAVYASEMGVQDVTNINWSFFHGVIERVHIFAQKSVNRVNRVAIAYHAKSLSRIIEKVLSAIPEASESSYKVTEKAIFDKMVRDLLFLKMKASGGEMALSHGEN